MYFVFTPHNVRPWNMYSERYVNLLSYSFRFMSYHLRLAVHDTSRSL